MADIILTNICKSFGDKVLFREYSLEIEHGDFVAIMGASGSGKTTLLNIMGLLEKPDSGEITLCGQKKLPFPLLLQTSCGEKRFPTCSRTTV